MGIEVLAAASIASTIAGGVVSAMGANQTAEANAQSQRYQAQVAENNRIIALQNATYAREAGQAQEFNQQLKTRALLGTQKAQQGANGLDVNSGSPLDVRTSTAELGKLDALTIMNSAEREAKGYEATASNFGAEAQLRYMTADNELTAGKYKVASSLIGTASSVSDKWLGYRTKGIY